MNRFPMRMALATMALLAAACTQGFMRPAREALVPGQAHYADVVRALGRPTFRNEDVTVNGEHITTADYYTYRFPRSSLDDSPHRYLHCSFFKGVLVGEEYNSSFPEDATRFDPDKAHLLAIGRSTRTDVVAALGPPSGEIMYPLVKDRDGRGLVYWYTAYHNLSELRAGEMYAPEAHRLIVFLNGQGIVTDLSYKGSDGREQYPGHLTSRLSAQQSPLSPIAY